MHGMDKRYIYYPRDLWAGCHVTYGLLLYGLLWAGSSIYLKLPAVLLSFPLLDKMQENCPKVGYTICFPRDYLNKPCIIFLSCLRFLPFFSFFLPQTMNLLWPCFKNEKLKSILWVWSICDHWQSHCGMNWDY